MDILTLNWISERRSELEIETVIILKWKITQITFSYNEQQWKSRVESTFRRLV